MPSIETVGLILLVGVAALGLFGWWWHRRNVLALFAENLRYRKKLRRVTRERDAAANKLLEFEPQLAEFVTLKQQSAGYHQLVKTVQRERDSWRDLYYSQATGHDNAQRWMMREHQSLAQQVKQLGGKPKMDPTILEMRAEFEAEHGQNIEDHKSGKAAESHAQTVQQETERAAELATEAPSETDPK